MNAFTAALLLIWSGISVLSAFFAPSPYPGLISLAFNLAAWAIYSRHDPLDDNRHPDSPFTRPRDRW